LERSARRASEIAAAVYAATPPAPSECADAYANASENADDDGDGGGRAAGNASDDDGGGGARRNTARRASLWSASFAAYARASTSARLATVLADVSGESDAETTRAALEAAVRGGVLSDDGDGDGDAGAALRDWLVSVVRRGDVRAFHRAIEWLRDDADDSSAAAAAARDALGGDEGLADAAAASAAACRRGDAETAAALAAALSALPPSAAEVRSVVHWSPYDPVRVVHVVRFLRTILPVVRFSPSTP
jgi:hypothetical protein